MAYAKLIGKDQALAALRSIPEQLRGEGIRRAVREGAKVYQAAIENAAAGIVGPPHTHEHHTIRDNIVIQQMRRPDIYYKTESDAAAAFRVGPSKDAYHGHFIEEGWDAVGRAVDIRVNWHGLDRGVQKTRRKQRTAHGNTHSQQGAPAARHVPGRGFVKQALESNRGAAMNAMIRAIQSSVARLKKKGLM